MPGWLPECDVHAIVGCSLYESGIQPAEAPAPGAHRHVGCRENVLVKEVSGRRRACNLLRRPHRAEAPTAPCRRPTERNPWRGRVDGLARPTRLRGPRIGLP